MKAQKFASGISSCLSLVWFAKQQLNSFIFCSASIDRTRLKRGRRNGREGTCHQSGN